MDYFKNVPIITDKKRYLLLSWTWGFPTSFVGSLVALYMLLTGHKPRKWGPCIYFEAGESWGGMDWGPFFVVDKNSDEHMRNHEMGHSFQNCRFGPLMPLVVGLPSSCRYWYRRLYRRLRKKYPKKGYDAAWFEGQATKLGTAYMKACGGGLHNA